MKESGQSLVELAVSMTILIFLLSGIVEFGLAFFQFVQLRDAVQEGALYGSACACTPAEMEARVRTASNTPIDLSDPAKVTVIISATDGAGNPKDVALMCESDGLKVEAVFVHHIFMPFMPQLIGRADIPLRASVTDTVLRPVCP